MPFSRTTRRMCSANGPRPVRRRNRRRERVPAYRAESGCPAKFKNRDLRCMKLAIDNWRWADGFVYLRTGKRLPAQNTHIVIQFRRAPFVLSATLPSKSDAQSARAAHPAGGRNLPPVRGQSSRSSDASWRSGHEFRVRRLLRHTASTGLRAPAPRLHDRRPNAVSSALTWSRPDGALSVLSSMLWKALPPRNFPNYPAGTWGPKEAEELLERDGRHWRNFEKMIWQATSEAPTQAGVLRCCGWPLQPGSQPQCFPAVSTVAWMRFVTKFVDSSSVRPDAACFGVAGPVRNGVWKRPISRGQSNPSGLPTN